MTDTLPSSAALRPAGDGWIKLVDYGEYAHRLGLQIINHAAATRMVQHFQSLVQRLARRFRGIPIYIGHPDDAFFQGKRGHDDTRAYGWVKYLAVRDDGLWIYPKWSKSGMELLENAHFKFLSPRWEMEDLGDRRFAPRQLISIGLTNSPNIPVEAIANQEVSPSIVELQLPENCPAAAKISSPTSADSMDFAAFLKQLEKLILGENAGETCCQSRSPQVILEKIREIMAENSRLKRQTDAFQIPDGVKPLSNADARSSLPICHESRTLDLPQRERGDSQSRRSGHLLKLVKRRMECSNETFAEAWRQVKLNSPCLFEALTFSNLEN